MAERRAARARHRAQCRGRRRGFDRRRRRRQRNCLDRRHRRRGPRGKRDLVAESLLEYGSRVGFWRLYELFADARIALTVNACCAGAGAQSGSGRRDPRGRVRCLLSRPALCPPFFDERGRGTPGDCRRRRKPHAERRPRSARLAEPLFAERGHAASARRSMAAFSTTPTAMPTTCPIGSPWRDAASRGSAHLHHQRQPAAERQDRHRPTIFTIISWRVPHAVRRKRAPAAHDDGEPAQPRLRPAGPLRGGRAVSRSRAQHRTSGSPAAPTSRAIGSRLIRPQGNRMMAACALLITGGLVVDPAAGASSGATSDRRRHDCRGSAHHRNRSRAPDAAVHDASDWLILPGLVNCHTHGHANLMKGVADRWTLEASLDQRALARRRPRSRDDVSLHAARRRRHGVERLHRLLRSRL